MSRPPAGSGVDRRRNNSAYRPSFDGVISALRSAIRACEGTKVTYFPHDRNGIVEFREDIIKIKRGVTTRVRRVFILEHRYKAGWVVDADFNNCMICYREFGWYRGRPKHHCRACGGLVCHDCSPYLAVIPYVEEEKGSRVCKNCFGLKPGLISPMSTASVSPMGPGGMNPEASMYYVPPVQYDLVVPPTALFTSPTATTAGNRGTNTAGGIGDPSYSRQAQGQLVATANRPVPSSAIQGSVQGTINGKVRRRTKITPKREAEDSLIRKYIEEMEKFEAEQKPKYEEAYRKMRELIPLDIHKSSMKGLIAYGIPEETAYRIWNTKILWLIVTHPEDIAKIHLADFRSKYNFDGLDIIEMRAVWNILPKWNMESDNPLERGKSEWRDGFKSKLDDIVYKEVRGTLAAHIVRNPVYEDADFLHLFDPEADVRPRFHRSASFFNEAVESPVPNGGVTTEEDQGHDDDSYGLSPLLAKSPLGVPLSHQKGQPQRRMSVQDRQKMYMDNFKSPDEVVNAEKKEKKFKTLLEEINHDEESGEEEDDIFRYNDGELPSPIPQTSPNKLKGPNGSSNPATNMNADFDDDVSSLGQDDDTYVSGTGGRLQNSFSGSSSRPTSYRGGNGGYNQDFEAQTAFPPSSVSKVRFSNKEEALTPVPSPQHPSTAAGRGNGNAAATNSAARPKPAPLTRVGSTSSASVPPVPPSPSSPRQAYLMRSQSLNFNQTTSSASVNGAESNKVTGSADNDDITVGSMPIPTNTGNGAGNDSRYGSFSTVSSVGKGAKLQYIAPQTDATINGPTVPGLPRANSFRGPSTSSQPHAIPSPQRYSSYRGTAGIGAGSRDTFDETASYGSYRDDHLSSGPHLNRANSERFTSSTGGAASMSQSYNAVSPIASGRIPTATPRTREPSIKPVQFPTFTPRNAGATGAGGATTGGQSFGGAGIRTSEKVLSPYSVESLQSTSEAFYTPYHQHRMATTGSVMNTGEAGENSSKEHGDSTIGSMDFTSVGSAHSAKFLSTSRDFGRRMPAPNTDEISPITAHSMVNTPMNVESEGLFTAVSSTSKSPNGASQSGPATSNDAKSSMNMNKLFDEIQIDGSEVPPPPSNKSPSHTPSGSHSKKMKKPKPSKDTVIAAINQGDILQVITLLDSEPVNSILSHEEVLDVFWDCSVKLLQMDGSSEESIQLQDMVLFLIDDGSINVNNCNIVSGESLLHLAITSAGFERLGRELVKRGADILLMDNDGNCPLSLFLLQEEEDWLLDEFESSGKEMKLLAFGSSEKKLRYISYFILTGQSTKARELIGSGHIKISASEATELMNSCRGNFESMTDPVDTFELLSSLGAELEV